MELSNPNLRNNSCIEGKADLIGIARAIHDDSKWAERAAESLKND
ncbi:hypothetical protein DOT_4658 [Desulfosporosinus sp. OT]|nr:hypothetical protein DOT_4658 [Desulfosporosinus sp. OT]